MSALLTIAADPSATVIVAGLSDTLNGAIVDWTGVARGGAVLAAIIIVLVTAIKTRLAIASTLLSVVVAGFLLWAVTADGLGWFSNGIEQEFAASPAVSWVANGGLI